MSLYMNVSYFAAQIEGHTAALTSGQEVAKAQLAVTACVDCCCWQEERLPAIRNIFRRHGLVKGEFANILSSSVEEQVTLQHVSLSLQALEARTHMSLATKAGRRKQASTMPSA